MTRFPFLRSLEITGFRGLSTLQIPKLSRINLIVGKNNVGKSSILEALRLYASNGSLAVATQILESRDEGRLTKRQLREDPGMAQAIPKLFHSKRESGIDGRIVIGPQSDPSEQLRIELKTYIRVEEEGRRVLRAVDQNGSESQEELLQGLSVKRNGGEGQVYLLDSDFIRRYYRIDESENTSYHYVPANGLSDRQIADLWDLVSLSETEEDVISSLKILLPELERVVMVGDASEEIRSRNAVLRDEFRSRIAIARVAGNDARIPLRTLGEGMNRLFGIALALVNSENGLLLIDEIESGLHWSVQSEVWKLIFGVAARLNVQVFATSHSKDCVSAFEEIAGENTANDGCIVRLERRGEQIGIFEFEKEELSIALKNNIEIR